MHAFGDLADPVRRRAIELISQSERASGEIVTVVEAEFGISQSAVSQHLRILRESGFARVRREGTKRCYSIDPAEFEDIDIWLSQVRHFWLDKMEDLAVEESTARRSFGLWVGKKPFLVVYVRDPERNTLELE